MKLRKLSALLMAVVMLLGMLPAGHADGGNQLAGGVMTVSCNHKMSWVYPNGPAKDCRTEAVAEYKCSLCGYVERTQHQAGECVGSGKWTWDGPKPANCQEEGLLVENCKYCGRGVDERNARGDHNWKTESKKATCTEGGYTRTYCTACGDVKEDTTTKARGHNFDNFVLTREPTCVEYGRKRGECTRCDATIAYNVKTIPHTWTEWTVIQEATAEQEGIREKHCTMCGLTEQERFRVGEENESANEVKNAMTVEVVSALPVYPNVGDSFVVELLVTNTGDTILSYAGTSLSNSDSDILGSPSAGGVDINMLNPGESFIVPVTVTVTDADQALNYVERAFTVQMNVWANEKVGFMTPANKDTENDVSYPINVGLTGSASIAMLMQEETVELPTVELVKTIDTVPANGEYFVPGEEIRFSLTMYVYGPGETNFSEAYQVDQAEIHDPLLGEVDLLVRDDPAYNMGHSFLYTVTEEDAARGYVENTGYATWIYQENCEAGRVESNTVSAPCGYGELPADGLELTLTLASTPANGTHFVLGEEVTFVESWVNNTSYTLDPFAVYTWTCHEPVYGSEIDQLSSCWFSDDGPVMPGATGSHSLTVIVTEADVARGSIYACAETSAAVQNGPDLENVLAPYVTAPCSPGELPAPSDDVPGGVVVSKSVIDTPANGEYYVVGEGIKFQITVQNNLNQTVDTVVVTDPLAAEFYVETGEIPAGGMYDTSLIYYVTEFDAAVGSVTNYAFATVYVNRKPSAHTSNFVTVPVGYADGEAPFGTFSSIGVVKAEESLPLNGKFYTEGEVIHYTITYTNDGEQPLTDVEIWDSLNINAPIASAELLNPGESRVCYYQHTVTAGDTVFGCVANMAIASYPIPGGAGYASVNSNVVFSQTNERGYPDFYWFETLQPGEDSGYDPGSGFPGLDGAETPFGTIDSGKLHGDDYCKRAIVSRDGTSVSYEWVYCPDHAAIQSSNLIMSQAATIPATKMQAAAYAVAMWRTEVEKIYKEMFEAADPVAKGVIMTEYVRFLSDAASYEVMLNLLYPDQPDVVAVKMAALWENKCMTLCYEAHAEPSARADSLTSILPVAGTGSDKCSCITTAEENGKKAYTITYCPTHSFPFAMIDALLAGQDTADAWTIVRQIWMVELNKAYGTIASQLGDNGMVATAEFNMLTQWMMAREATLIALYPDNPELVMQMMTVLMMDRTNDLCQMYQ